MFEIKVAGSLVLLFFKVLVIPIFYLLSCQNRIQMHQLSSKYLQPCCYTWIHLNTSDITSHGTDLFHVKAITPGHPIPKISTRLTFFWRCTWKTEFVKTIRRQERTSSEKKSDGLHKKCSIELWTILLFELLLIQQRGAWNEHIY